MRISRTIALGASTLALLTASTASVSAQSSPIRIGNDNFTESALMAEIYAQALEAKGVAVDRLGGLGQRPDRAPAFEAGQVDLVPEYVGSGLGHYTVGATDPALLALTVTGDGVQNRTNLQAAFAVKHIDASVLGITPAQDTNAGVVRPDTAATYKLTKMSDLAAVQDQLRWGLPADCDANPLCKGALEQYGITYPPKQREALGPCNGPIADALQGNAIDFGWLCSTQPAIAQYGFVTLEDDLHIQPAENIAPIVRNAALSAAGLDVAAISAILDPVSAGITTEGLTKMVVDVDVNHQDLKDVAAAYLASMAAPTGSAAPAGSAAP